MELAFAIHAGVRAAEMEAEAAVAHGIIFKAKALEINFFARRDILVIDFLAVVVSVGQLSLVEVVTGLGEDDSFLPDVNADAIDGCEVLPEELFLLEGGTVGDVQIHLHALELQLVAQRDVVDELALLVFNHVH